MRRKNHSFAGFFGEVFRGVWNGTDVAIKVFLEQDLTAENMEDFCNEISILRYFLLVMLSFRFFLLYLTVPDLYALLRFFPAGSDIQMVYTFILTCYYI